MAAWADIAVGMPVIDTDGRPLGTVEAVGDDALTVGTTEIPREAIAAVREGAIYLHLAISALAASPDIPPLPGADATTTEVVATGEQLVVPIVEERLAVGARTVD